MALQSSNFTRQPERRQGTEGAAMCPACGSGYTETMVEQFDGEYLAEGCPTCHFNAIHREPLDSPAHLDAKALKVNRRLNALLVGSGITPRFRGSTFDSFVTDGSDPTKLQALQKCRAYAEQFPKHYQAGRAVLLVGHVGTGKTHLACAIAQHVIREHGAKAVITSVSEVIRAAKGTMRKGAQYTESDVIAELASFDLLVLDEVGAQAGTEYERGLLHEVIDRRYQLVLPTILVSNMTIEQLKGFIGERALDRLRQGGGMQIVFSWGSARREVGA